jgi:uncharacterized repeat protein (TIGR01451 family)
VGGLAGLSITTTSQGDNSVTSSKSLVLNVIAPKIDLTVTASVNNPAPTEDITYTITATNNGHAPAKSIRAELPIPAHTSYKTGSIYVDNTLMTDALNDDQGGFDSQNTKLVAIKTGDLGIGESFVILITVTVH